jgi:hypothetical protein
MKCNEYSGPTSQEPKPMDATVYEERGPVRGFTRVLGLCYYCQEAFIGLVHDDLGRIVAYVHPQKPNGQPDICNKEKFYAPFEETTA